MTVAVSVTSSDAGADISRLARGSLLAFATYIAGAALAYISQLLVARLTGPTSYGYYAYALALMTILAYVAALGFDVSLLRLIPAYRTVGNWPLARGALCYAERRSAAAGCLIMAGGALLLWFRRASLPGEELRALALGLPLVPICSLLWISAAAVRAFGGVVAALAPDRIVRDGGLVVALAVLTVWHAPRLDAATVMLISVTCALGGLVIVRKALRRWRPRAVTEALTEYAPAIWRGTTLPLVSISIAETLLNRAGVVLLGCSDQSIGAGVYALAFNFSMTVTLPRIAVNTLFAPLVSELWVRGDRAALQSVVTRSARWTLLSGLSVALPLMLLAEPLLSWFGRDFAQGVTALRLLLAGQIVASAFGPQMFLMTMTGNERAAATLLIVSTVVNGVLGVLLIQVIGLTGAALATTAALVVWNVTMALFVWRALGVVPGPASGLSRLRVA